MNRFSPSKCCCGECTAHLTVKDCDNLPVAGVYVATYAIPTLGLPVMLAVDGPTDASGQVDIHVPSTPGTYYLASFETAANVSAFWTGSFDCGQSITLKTADRARGVTVTVTGCNSAGVEGATVAITGPDGKKTYGTTASDGKFRFMPWVAGSYSITMSKSPEFVSATNTPFLTPCTASNVNRTLTVASGYTCCYVSPSAPQPGLPMGRFVTVTTAGGSASVDVLPTCGVGICIDSDSIPIGSGKDGGTCGVPVKVFFDKPPADLATGTISVRLQLNISGGVAGTGIVRSTPLACYQPELNANCDETSRTYYNWIDKRDPCRTGYTNPGSWTASGGKVTVNSLRPFSATWDFSDPTTAWVSSTFKNCPCPIQSVTVTGT